MAQPTGWDLNYTRALQWLDRTQGTIPCDVTRDVKSFKQGTARCFWGWDGSSSPFHVKCPQVETLEMPDLIRSLSNRQQTSELKQSILQLLLLL